jgi:hypothetical protein
MGIDSPNHTKSSPSGARFFLDAVIRHRDSNRKFDTSGKITGIRSSSPGISPQGGLEAQP